MRPPRIRSRLLVLAVIGGVVLSSAPAASAVTVEPTIPQLIGAALVVRMNGTSPDPSLLKRVRLGEVGGIVLFKSINITTKTALVAATRKLQAAAADDVTSPTFTLIHEYRGPQANLYHIDLYRIDTPRQLETLGVDDLIADNSILLIEWGEKFQRFERERDVEIALERVNGKLGQPVGSSENDRRIRITSK